MAPNRSQWVYQFRVEDPQRHIKGFTVYKLTSVVFPKGSPEAGTKLVIWKRYNDFKRLYRCLIKICKLLNIASPPSISRGSFFNRFEDEVIKERVLWAQSLLDFIGENRVLFLSEEFQEFSERGYTAPGKAMGQGESVSCETQPELRLENPHWRWSDETSRWRSEGSESSEEDSGALSSESGGSAGGRAAKPAPPLDNSVNNRPDIGDRPSVASGELGWNNNSSCTDETEASSLQLKREILREYSLEVLDVAGGGFKPLPCPPVDVDTEVVCVAERPVAQQDVWLSLPPPEQRLQAYRIVAILDPVLVVVHSARPDHRLALKVMRKSCWPVAPPTTVGEPRPVPHMVRLVDWIETEDAVFLVTELVTSGRLWDHVRHKQDPVPDVVPAPDANLDVDSLVQHAQRLLASVSRTLERSAAQHREISTEEGRGRKHRSHSVLPRPRLERRFSSGDATGPRPRTAHSSIDRASRGRVSRIPEATTRDWAASLVACVDTLHSRGIVWRDLYPGNLLYGSGGRLLTTFQHQWRGVEPPLHPAALASGFVAPEVLSVFPPGPACDWWSVGIILYELLTGVPLCEVHPRGLTSHSTLEISDSVSVEARSLLTSLIQYSPSERLGSGPYGSEEIMCHPFFAGIDWEQIYNEL